MILVPILHFTLYILVFNVASARAYAWHNKKTLCKFEQKCVKVNEPMTRAALST